MYSRSNGIEGNQCNFKMRRWSRGSQKGIFLPANPRIQSYANAKGLWAEKIKKTDERKIGGAWTAGGTAVPMPSFHSRLQKAQMRGQIFSQGRIPCRNCIQANVDLQSSIHTTQYLPHRATQSLHIKHGSRTLFPVAPFTSFINVIRLSIDSPVSNRSDFLAPSNLSN